MENFGKPIEQDNTIFIDDPDIFFEEIYKQPYEDLCAEDHNDAKKAELTTEQENDLKEFGKNIYLIAYKKYPNPELAGLFSDDIDTIYKLIIKNYGKLKPFTLERMNHYLKGRFPCGYRGNFPKGKWIVA